MQHIYKNIFVCLLCMWISVSAFSQNKKEDSLLQALKTQKDTASIRTLLKLASLHFRDTTDEATRYLNKAYTIAKPSGEKKYLGDYFISLGSYKEKQGDPDAAVDNYKNALIMYKVSRYFPGQINA